VEGDLVMRNWRWENNREKARNGRKRGLL